MIEPDALAYPTQLCEKLARRRAYEACYEVLWHCAQNMAYVDFKGVWPKPGTNIHPEVVEITPTGNNTLIQNLNSNLPERLKIAIADDPILNQKVREICIDGSKFIERDNPAAKIHTEMVKAGCPKNEDGTPESLTELQTYWDWLAIDRIPILLFYESPTGSPQGFSETFLNALSKFGADRIGVITEQPLNLPHLHWFSPSQSLEDILGWMRAISLENLPQ